MENTSNIAKAFIKAQSEMNNASKNSQNPFHKNKYADLNSVREAVLPILNKHGISVLQPIVSENGKNYVKTVLLHESGQTIESLTEIIYSKLNDAQSQGSGITYARRYGLQSLVCIGADDDDGNMASSLQKNTQNGKGRKTENKELLTKQHPKWESIVNMSDEQKQKVSLDYFREKYSMSEDIENEILIILKS